MTKPSVLVVEADVLVRHPLAEAFWGDLHGQIEDPFGHRWNLARHLRDVAPEDIARAAAEAFGGYGLRLHYGPGITMFLVIGVALFALMAWPGTGPGPVVTRAHGPVILAWTAAFSVAGILIYGPLLNAVVGIYSGGVYFPGP